MRYYYFLIIPLCLISFYIFYSWRKNKYQKLNKIGLSDKKTINPLVLPLIDNNRRYNELQLQEWIIKRENDETCFAMLEKDKIIMSKWLDEYNISRPKTRYYNYHDNFKIKEFKKLVRKNRYKRLVLKLSHLGNNYGIIIIEPETSDKELDKIFRKCEKLFETCYVSNNDDFNPPSEREIMLGKKDIYYKLNETIKPGIIIQDFFYSYEDGELRPPKEIKILLIGDKIINVDGYDDIENSRMEIVYQEARKITKILGSYIARIDFFVKERDNPYLPFINNITFTPEGGLNNLQCSYDILEQFKREIEKYEIGNYDDINKLVVNAPYRDIPVKKYLSDKGDSKSKFKF